MRPSFNSRGMPSSFVTSTDVSLRREKPYPRENNETFISFLFTSFHFPASAVPSHFEIPTRAPAPIYTGWPESTRTIIGVFSGKKEKNLEKILEDLFFFDLESRGIEKRIMDSWNDFRSIFSRLQVFLYGQRERERSYSSLFSLDFPNLEETMRLLMPLS